MENNNQNNLFSSLWVDHRPIAIILIAATSLCLLVVGFVFLHFQLAVDIPLISISNPKSAEHWGQLGDFIGGILNPTLSFIAFLTLIYTLKMQSDELKEAREESKIAREEAKIANRTQEYQTKIFERQSFESAFFGLLNAHLKIIENIKYQDNDEDPVHTGRDALAIIAEKHLPFKEVERGDFFGGKDITAFRARSRSLLNRHQVKIGHYFRSLYQILKYIDSYGKPSLAPRKAKTLREMKEQLIKDRNNYLAQRQYANMLRAQFSSAEIDLIFANCLTPQGKELKYYIEKYSFLKTFNRKRLKGNPRILNLFSDIAYKDSDEINDLEFNEIINARPKYKNTKQSNNYSDHDIDPNAI